MPPQVWTTPLAAMLAQVGISTNTAGVLCSYYPDADPQGFVSGLDAIAQTMTTLLAPTSAPAEEPWATVGAALIGVPQGDIEDCFQAVMAPYAPELQGAITDAIRERIDALQTQQTQQAQKRRRAKSREYLQALNTLGYSFRMNELTDTIEVNGAPISDALAAQIRVQMRDAGFEYVNVMEDVYTAEAYQNKYHPVREYLNSLQYDGGQHIIALAGHFQDKDNTFAVWLRHWLIGAVAKAHTGDQNYMLVLDGPQGLGKSHFTRWLGSVLPGYCKEAPIDLEDKDAYVRLASAWLWEVSEFGATVRRADREALKSFISMQTVTVRRAYARYDMVKPALASFIGTVNNESGILSDPTGSRRFLICCLTSIDWNYATAVNPHQVWAEANAAYLAGESWRLTADEKRRAESINEQYEVEDPIEGLLKKHFQVDSTNPFWTSTVDILLALESNGLKGGNTRQNSMALASVATKLGLTKKKQCNKNGQLVWGYRGVEPL